MCIVRKEIYGVRLTGFLKFSFLAPIILVKTCIYPGFVIYQTRPGKEIPVWYLVYCVYTLLHSRRIY